MPKPLKCIVAGSRGIMDFDELERAIKLSGFDIWQIVSGTARGVDRLGEYYARKNHLSIKRFPADWVRWGKKAGYKRNVEMAEYADALIAVWDGKSRGTMHMINIAKQRGLRVFVHTISIVR